MKLTKKIPLLIGVAVFVTAISINSVVDRIISTRLEQSAFDELSGQARANAELIKAKLDADLSQLWEIANRARTRTMDWDGVVRQNLTPDIPRIGVLELGIVTPGDYTGYYVSNDSRAYMGELGFIREAFDT